MVAELSTPQLLGLFGVAALVILAAGLRMTRLADQIADRTGWGEALIGGALLGGATSLSGITVSVTAALSGEASLAFSNAVGGIAAQTAFLALGDIFYRRVNLEHAAAEPANLFQATLLAMMMALAAFAVFGPDLTIWGVHPASLILLGSYAAGLVATARVREAPMWRAVETRETRADEPESEDEANASAWGPLAMFVALMAGLGVAGWTIAIVAGELIGRLGLAASVVGALMTAVATSLPELVTTLAAVRRGALQLAMGGVIGGNTFDTLFLSFADMGYREGSIYHAIGPGDVFWLVTGLLMTALLLGGMVVRQARGPAGIGWESAAMLGVYAWAIVAQTVI